jgi:hypothetical protein
VYNNPQTEAAVKKAEQQNMIDVLASNKDRALRYEQTYNVLNFDNKLKGLEARDNYPKDKPWYFRPGKDTNCDYNIISNIDMQQHHFQPPEKRPAPNAPVSSLDLDSLGQIILVPKTGHPQRIQRCHEQVHRKP